MILWKPWISECAAPPGPASHRSLCCCSSDTVLAPFCPRDYLWLCYTSNGTAVVQVSLKLHVLRDGGWKAAVHMHTGFCWKTYQGYLGKCSPAKVIFYDSLNPLNLHKHVEERSRACSFLAFFFIEPRSVTILLFFPAEPLQTVSGRSWTLDRLMRSWIFSGPFLPSLCPSLEPFSGNQIGCWRRDGIIFFLFFLHFCTLMQCLLFI